MGQPGPAAPAIGAWLRPDMPPRLQCSRSLVMLAAIAAAAVGAAPQSARQRPGAAPRCMGTRWVPAGREHMRLAAAFPGLQLPGLPPRPEQSQPGPSYIAARLRGRSLPPAPPAAGLHRALVPIGVARLRCRRVLAGPGAGWRHRRALPTGTSTPAAASAGSRLSRSAPHGICQLVDLGFPPQASRGAPTLRAGPASCQMGLKPISTATARQGCGEYICTYVSWMHHAIFHLL